MCHENENQRNQRPGIPRARKPDHLTRGWAGEESGSQSLLRRRAQYTPAGRWMPGFLASGRAFEQILYGVSSRDPLTYLTANGVYGGGRVSLLPGAGPASQGR
jgi:hypothetical protein